MAPCDNNPKCCSSNCPIKSKKNVKISIVPTNEKRVATNKKPQSVNTMNPVWHFHKCDKEGNCAFTVQQMGSDFCAKVLPRLQAYECMTWNEISINDKKSNHTISVEQLNACAQKRLRELKIEIDNFVV